VEFAFVADDVKNHIRALSGEPNLENAHAAAKYAAETFEAAKSEIVSILQTELEEHEDAFLRNLKDELGKLEALSTFEVADRLSPKGQIMTRDTIVVGHRIPANLHAIRVSRMYPLTPIPD
jgi:hypothetical protein